MRKGAKEMANRTAPTEAPVSAGTNGKRTRTKIDAKPVMKAVDSLPEVARLSTSKVYEDLTASLAKANAGNPGKWFIVFEALPNIGAAQSRAKVLKGYEGVEATSRSNKDGTASVYARHGGEAK